MSNTNTMSSIELQTNYYGNINIINFAQIVSQAYANPSSQGNLKQATIENYAESRYGNIAAVVKIELTNPDGTSQTNRHLVNLNQQGITGFNVTQWSQPLQPTEELVGGSNNSFAIVNTVPVDNNNILSYEVKDFSFAVNKTTSQIPSPLVPTQTSYVPVSDNPPAIQNLKNIKVLEGNSKAYIVGENSQGAVEVYTQIKSGQSWGNWSSQPEKITGFAKLIEATLNGDDLLLKINQQNNSSNTYEYYNTTTEYYKITAGTPGISIIDQTIFDLNLVKHYDFGSIVFNSDGSYFDLLNISQNPGDLTIIPRDTQVINNLVDYPDKYVVVANTVDGGVRRSKFIIVDKSVNNNQHSNFKSYNLDDNLNFVKGSDNQLFIFDKASKDIFKVDLNKSTTGDITLLDILNDSQNTSIITFQDLQDSTNAGSSMKIDLNFESQEFKNNIDFAGTTDTVVVRINNKLDGQEYASKYLIKTNVIGDTTTETQWSLINNSVGINPDTFETTISTASLKKAASSNTNQVIDEIIDLLPSINTGFAIPEYITGTGLVNINIDHPAASNIIAIGTKLEDNFNINDLQKTNVIFGGEGSDNININFSTSQSNVAPQNLNEIIIGGSFDKNGNYVDTNTDKVNLTINGSMPIPSDGTPLISEININAGNFIGIDKINININNNNTISASTVFVNIGDGKIDQVGVTNIDFNHNGSGQSYAYVDALSHDQSVNFKLTQTSASSNQTSSSNSTFAFEGSQSNDDINVDLTGNSNFIYVTSKGNDNVILDKTDGNHIIIQQIYQQTSPQSESNANNNITYVNNFDPTTDIVDFRYILSQQNQAQLNQAQQNQAQQNQAQQNQGQNIAESKITVISTNNSSQPSSVTLKVIEATLTTDKTLSTINLKTNNTSSSPLAIEDINFASGPQVYDSWLESVDTMPIVGEFSIEDEIFIGTDDDYDELFVGSILNDSTVYGGGGDDTFKFINAGDIFIGGGGVDTLVLYGSRNEFELEYVNQLDIDDQGILYNLDTIFGHDFTDDMDFSTDIANLMRIGSTNNPSEDYFYAAVDNFKFISPGGTATEFNADFIIATSFDLTNTDDYSFQYVLDVANSNASLLKSITVSKDKIDSEIDYLIKNDNVEIKITDVDSVSKTATFVLGSSVNNFKLESAAEKNEIIGNDQSNFIFFKGNIDNSNDIDIKSNQGDDVVILENFKYSKVSGGQGDDVIISFGGQYSTSKIYGDDGNDKIFGGEGDDDLFGGDGNDLIFGDIGDDIITGGSGGDQLFGGMDDDDIDAGSGNDYVHGGSDSDVIDGGSGNDTISGGAGSDRLLGNSGNDFIGNDDQYSDFNFDITLTTSTSTIDVNFISVELDSTSVGSDVVDELLGGSGSDAFYIDSEISNSQILIYGGSGFDKVNQETSTLSPNITYIDYIDGDVTIAPPPPQEIITLSLNIAQFA